MTSSVSWGCSRQTLRSLLIYTLEPTGFVPPELMHLWDPLSALVFPVGQILSDRGWVPTPATIFPCWEDHVNNHLSLGFPPRTRIREPRVKSSHSSQIRRYRALQPGHSPPGQVEDASSHTGQLLAMSVRGQSSQSENLVNSRQVKSKMRLRTRSTLRRVQSKMHLRTRSTFRRVKSGSILANQKVSEPFQLGQLSARSGRRCGCIFAHGQLSAVSSQGLPSHPIKLSVGLSWVSSPVSCTVPASVSDHVTPVPSLSPPVLYQTDRPSAILCNVSFIFHFFWYCLCPTKHHTGYESRTAYGPTRWIRGTARDPPSVTEVDVEYLYVPSLQ